MMKLIFFVVSVHFSLTTTSPDLLLNNLIVTRHVFIIFFAVDSVYIQSFGRRKSWLVPVQYMIGIFLFILSYKISALIGGGFTPTKDGGERFNYTTLAQVYVHEFAECGHFL